MTEPQQQPKTTADLEEVIDARRMFVTGFVDGLANWDYVKRWFLRELSKNECGPARNPERVDQWPEFTVSCIRGCFGHDEEYVEFTRDPALVDGYKQAWLNHDH